jgi:hypothetical protein
MNSIFLPCAEGVGEYRESGEGVFDTGHADTPPPAYGVLPHAFRAREISGVSP